MLGKLCKKLFRRSAPAVSWKQTWSTIDLLRSHEQSLDARRQQLIHLGSEQLDKARAFSLAGDRQQALQSLRRKKLLAFEMASLDEMIMRVNTENGLVWGLEGGGESEGRVEA